MEIFLVLGLIVVLLIRWAISRDRMAEMESRIKELTGRVDAQSQALAEIYRTSHAAPAAGPAARFLRLRLLVSNRRTGPEP